MLNAVCVFEPLNTHNCQLLFPLTHGTTMHHANRHFWKEMKRAAGAPSKSPRATKKKKTPAAPARLKKGDLVMITGLGENPELAWPAVFNSAQPAGIDVDFISGEINRSDPTSTAESLLELCFCVSHI